MEQKQKAANSGGNRRGRERTPTTPTPILGGVKSVVNHYHVLRRQAEARMDAARAAGDDRLSKKHFRVWLAMLCAEWRR